MTQPWTSTVFQVALWATLLYAGLAWGQIYGWTDRSGQRHFTDNLSRIPSEYRARATLYRETSPALPDTPRTPSEDAAKAPEVSLAPPSQPQALAEPRDRLGQGPEYWRDRARKWSAELQQHMAERERLQLLYNHTRTLADSTRDTWDRGRLEAEVERLGKAIADIDQRIEQAQTMLQTTLPLEAIQLGANPEWLQDPTAPSH